MSCPICSKSFEAEDTYPRRFIISCCENNFHLHCLESLILRGGVVCPACQRPLTKFDKWIVCQQSQNDEFCGICQLSDSYIEQFGKCKHRYHRTCLAKWVSERQNTSYQCPQCRAPITEVAVLENWQRQMNGRAILNFFVSKDYQYIESHLTDNLYKLFLKYYKNIEMLEFTNKILPNSWTLEQILTYFWEHHRSEIDSESAKMLKSKVREIHDCDWECDSGYRKCLVQTWRFEGDHGESIESINPSLAPTVRASSPVNWDEYIEVMQARLPSPYADMYPPPQVFSRSMVMNAMLPTHDSQNTLPANASVSPNVERRIHDLADQVERERDMFARAMTRHLNSGEDRLESSYPSYTHPEPEPENFTNLQREAIEYIARHWRSDDSSRSPRNFSDN
ncbi:hypothetical protein CDAR_109111 [Caerostris darwini]|uniref:RING-type domain-containing protein n=1 Tax=Caerostris darwini TaxID=1538125 RepID=A0AAV4PXM6_9ARAC|nr:hypothetical protein CDAR_109111 [Caerostris darwini]